MLKNITKSMEKRTIVLTLVLFLLCLNFVSSQPFITGEFLKGLTIESPVQEYIKQGEDHDFYFHVFNTSNGKYISDPAEADCFFHLYNESGKHIVEMKLPTYSSLFGSEWKADIKGDNFSHIGEYNFIVQCNTSYAGGFSEVTFRVSNSGRGLNISDSIIQLGFMFLLFGISASFLFLTLYIQEPAPKIFFLFTAFIFIIGSMIIAFIIGDEANIYDSVGSSMVNMIYAFGLIFFVVFAYIMIKITKASVDSFQANKGYDVEF